MEFIKKRIDRQSKTLFKNSSWVFFSNLFGAGIAFLRGIVIARGLGAEIFGIYTVIVAFIGTVQEVLNLNLGSVVIRFGTAYKSENRNDKLVSIIKLCFLASAIAALLSILIVIGLTYFSYNTFIKAPNLHWFAILYAIAASGLFFTQISRGALRLYFKFKINSIIQMIMDVSEITLIVVALFFFPKQLPYFMVAILISRFINGFIPNIAAYRELVPELKGHLSASIRLIKDQYKEIRNFTIHNSIAKTLQSLINTGDVLVIGLLSSSTSQVGFYAVGKRLAFSILTITDPLITSIYPQLCILYAENKIKEIKRMIFKLAAMAAIPSTIFMVIAIFFNEWIMKTIFGAEYIPAGKTFYLLTGTSLLYSIFFWVQPLLQTLNLMAVRLKIYALGMTTGLIVAYLLVPKYGSTGMAIAMIVMSAVMPGLFMYYALRKLNEAESEQTETPNTAG